MTRLSKELKEARRELAQMGGRAIAKKLGKRGMRALGRAGAAARKKSLEAGKIKK